MTQEEKAKRYDETLEQLKGLIEGTREDKCAIVEEDIINIFPELKESEDLILMNLKSMENKVMTQEEKQLLLIDLSARLPYGVKVEYLYWDESKCEEYPVPMVVYSVNADGYMELIGDVDEGGGHIEIDKYLPYLRPMSSMTEEEKKEFYTFQYKFTLQAHEYQELNKETFSEYLDWLNKNMFDYRGLIEKGLALEAPKGMYGMEEQK